MLKIFVEEINGNNLTDYASTPVTVTVSAADPAAIATAAIAGVTAPVKGAIPADSLAATAEYTAAISWGPIAATFGASTVYTATITLTPKAGYTLTGVAENFFAGKV